MCVLCSLVSDALWTHGLWPTRLLCPWDSPGKNAGVAISFSRDLPDPGIEPEFLTFPELAGGLFTSSTIWEAQYIHSMIQSHHSYISRTLKTHRSSPLNWKALCPPSSLSSLDTWPTPFTPDENPFLTYSPLKFIQCCNITLSMS